MSIDLFTEYKRFGIFGPSESGKSTLAKKISQEIFTREGRFTIALVPNDENVADWGAHSRVFRNEKQFWDFVFATENCLIVVDDGSETIARDAELSNVFTSMRHRKHKLMVIGHHATNLLPQMRDQLQRLFLFLQNEDSVKIWSRIFPGQDLACTTQLQQYEWITIANYKQPIRSKLLK